MKIVNIIIDIMLLITMIICFIYNMIRGVSNHDVYYLVLALFDYIILYLVSENIANDIDTHDNV